MRSIPSHVSCASDLSMSPSFTKQTNQSNKYVRACVKRHDWSQFVPPFLVAVSLLVRVIRMFATLLLFLRS